MIVSRKSTIPYLVKASLYIGIGTVGFMTLYYSVEKVDNLFVLIGLVLAIAVIIIGIYHGLGIEACKQTHQQTITIEHDYLLLDNKKIALDGSYLYFELYACHKDIAVSLYQEKGGGVRMLFQNIIFSPKEFETFLECIRPYRKLDLFPWKRYHTQKSFYVCKEGFILNGREIFYQEVASIAWMTEAYYRYTARFERVIVEMRLKSGELLTEIYLHANSMLYVKLAYIATQTDDKTIDEITQGQTMRQLFEKTVHTIEEKGCVS